MWRSRTGSRVSAADLPLLIYYTRGHNSAINAKATDQSWHRLLVVTWTYGNGSNPVANYFEGRNLRKVVCLMVDYLWLFMLVFEGRKKT